MAYRRTYAVFFGALVLLVLAVFRWGSIHPARAGTSLSVVFIGMTNNPARQMTPSRIAVCQGATNLCAMFRVSNSSSNRWIWFKTVAIEQKTHAGWQTFSPSGSWSGVEGRLWSPGYGCLFAVGWPPGLPTNTAWRLQLSYGKDPSLFGIVVNQRIGHEIFHSGKEEAVVPSSAVSE